MTRRRMGGHPSRMRNPQACHILSAMRSAMAGDRAGSRRSQRGPTPLTRQVARLFAVVQGQTWPRRNSLFRHPCFELLLHWELSSADKPLLVTGRVLECVRSRRLR